MVAAPNVYDLMWDMIPLSKKEQQIYELWLRNDEIALQMNRLKTELAANNQMLNEVVKKRDRQRLKRAKHKHEDDARAVKGLLPIDRTTKKQKRIAAALAQQRKAREQGWFGVTQESLDKAPRTPRKTNNE